jgi:hypothetical protein
VGCPSREAGQWAKLELYSNLALVMGAFVGLVSATTLVLVLARSGAFQWPWELYWVQTVLWEVLNLGVMVAVAVLWAPSARAKLLASSAQVPPSRSVLVRKFETTSVLLSLAST